MTKTGCVVALLAGLGVGLAIRAAVEHSRASVAEAAAETVTVDVDPVDVTPVSRPRVALARVASPLRFAWAPIRRVRPAGLLVVALIRLTLAALLATAQIPRIPRIHELISTRIPIEIPRSARAVRVDLRPAALRRSLPVRGPDIRRVSRWSFPGVVAVLT